MPRGSQYASPMPDSPDDDYPLEHSPLEREVTRDGTSVHICIYRGVEDAGWLLEVEDHLGGSTVWDDRFESDQAALDEAMRVIDENGTASFAASEQSPATKREPWVAQTAGGPIADVKRALDACDDMLSFHAACGVFAAVATAPERVPPAAWLEHIKGEHEFEGIAEVQGFTNGVMALYSGG